MVQRNIPLLRFSAPHLPQPPLPSSLRVRPAAYQPGLGEGAIHVKEGNHVSLLGRHGDRHARRRRQGRWRRPRWGTESVGGGGCRRPGRQRSRSSVGSGGSSSSVGSADASTGAEYGRAARAAVVHPRHAVPAGAMRPRQPPPRKRQRQMAGHCVSSSAMQRTPPHPTAPLFYHLPRPQLQWGDGGRSHGIGAAPPPPFIVRRASLDSRGRRGRRLCTGGAGLRELLRRALDENSRAASVG